MSVINRCQNCKIGTSFCVYTKTEKMVNTFGKTINEVPADNCIIGKHDEYAIFPDTEELDIGLDTPLMKMRECEYRAPLDVETSNSNLYLWESLTTNVTTGDTFNIYETIGKAGSNNKTARRFDYDHPLYHIIDYNVPVNTSGIVRLNENCFMMGNKNFYLVSKNWVQDDGGEEAKKAIGIPRVRYCVGLYGTMDNKSGIIMHKSMKDWTGKVPTFKNYTNQKVNPWQTATYNLFIHDFHIIDEFITSVLFDVNIKQRLYEGFALIKKGEYINIRQLLLNNNVDQKLANTISNTISTKNPKLIYNNADGYRYNITKVKHLYFNILEGIIDIKFNKKVILANIVNFILNDTTLLNHTINANTKHSQYIKWYNSICDDLSIELQDEFHPNRIKFNEYTSDNGLKAAIDIIVDAIYVQKILDIKNVPETFKQMFKRYKEYIKNYNEDKDIFDIGAPILNIKEYLNIKDERTYKDFSKFLQHINIIKPLELKELWEQYCDSVFKNDCTLFWNYVEDMAFEHNMACQKLMMVHPGQDDFEPLDITPSDGPYFKIKQKRYYNKNDQYNEHKKLYNPMEDFDIDNMGYDENYNMFDLNEGEL